MSRGPQARLVELNPQKEVQMVAIPASHTEKFTSPLHSDDSRYWFGDRPPPAIRTVTVDQSSRWLARGWNDMMAAPVISLSYGAVFVVAAYLITFGLIQAGMGSLTLPLAAGFMLIGPLAAVGLYETSRSLSRNQKPTMGAALGAFGRRLGPLLVVGLLLMMMFMAWFLVAMVIFAIFYGTAPPTLTTFFSTMMLAPQAPLFLLVGTGAGALLATAVFGISAISLPMIIDRDVSPVHAMAVSARAVTQNWKVMIGWAAMIALLIGVGMATFYIGLAITLPLVGHATWHCYKAIID